MARPDLSAGMSANLNRDKKKPSRRELLSAFLDEGDHAEVAKRIVEDVGAAPVASVNTETPLPPVTVAPLTTAEILPEPHVAPVKNIDHPDNLGYTSDATSHVTADTMSHETSHAQYNATSDDTSHDTSNEASDGQQNDAALQPTSHLTLRHTSRNASHPTLQPTPRQTERNTLHPTGHLTERQTLRHTDMFDPVFTLTWKQGMVLYHMLNRPGYITQRAMIEEHTGLPLPTIRDSIKRLTAEGFISKPVKYVQKTFQGLTYTVNRELCERFMSLRGHEFEAGIEPEKPRHSDRLTLRNTGRMTYQPIERPTEHPSSAAYDVPSNAFGTSSSSRFLHKTTTAENPEISLEHPELLWWTEQGLTVDQVLAWMRELSIPGDRILQYLKWAAADIPGKKDPVRKPVDWFYKIVSGQGRAYYPPAGYKSWEDLELEREIAEQEALEERNRQRAEIRRKKRIALFDEQFLDILDNPKGEDYKRLAATISPAFSVGSRLWENSMREAFLAEQGEI